MARFFTGKLIDSDNVDREVDLPLRYSPESPDGYACVFESSIADNASRRLEPGVVNNSQVNKVLLLRSKKVDNSTIKAKFSPILLPNGAIFKFTPSFLSGTTRDSDGVIYKVIVHYQDSARRNVWNTVLELKWLPGTIREEITVDISHLSGKSVGIELRNDSTATSTGDHAMWINPRIETRTGPNAKVWEIKPKQLTVNNRNETDVFSGKGDEPYIGAIYFRSVVNQRFSTKVKILDELQNLGENVRGGVALSIPDSAKLKIVDYGVNQSLSEGITNGVNIMGFIFIAMEADKIGKTVLRGKLRDAADALRLGLQEHVESDLGILVRSEQVLDKIQEKVQNAIFEERGIFDGFLEWIGRADDLIGVNKLILVGIDESILRGQIRDYNPTVTTDPLSSINERNFKLDFRGEGAYYSLSIDVKESTSSELV